MYGGEWGRAESYSVPGIEQIKTPRDLRPAGESEMGFAVAARTLKDGVVCRLSRDTSPPRREMSVLSQSVRDEVLWTILSTEMTVIDNLKECDAAELFGTDARSKRKKLSSHYRATLRGISIFF